VPDLAGAVAVPLLLSGGYHARVDLPARAPRARITRPVGPDPLLAVALADRLGEAGYAGGPVVLAAAGSTDPAAQADVQAQAGLLAAHLGQPVTPAYLSAARPQVADLAAGGEAGPSPVAPVSTAAPVAAVASVAAVAAYLLAPGRFADQLAADVAGRAPVSAPLGDHPAVAEVVLDRYDEARAAAR
jgi:sirohydrochlorin ferrochelatase